MSPTKFVTMCLTSRAASLLREAVRFSDSSRISPFNQAAKSELGYALSLQKQHGGGDLYLSNEPAMRNMVSALVWTAAKSGPSELQSSFRTLHGVFEKFSTVLNGEDAKEMTQRLLVETAVWRKRGCMRDELPALYKNVYMPLATAIRENADVMMRDGVDHWVEALIENADVIYAFRQIRDLRAGHVDMLNALYLALGMHHLYKSLVTICSDLFQHDYESMASALTAESQDNAAAMITFDYSLSGLCMLSDQGEAVIFKMGCAAEYVRRRSPFAVPYITRMGGEFNFNPVAEHSRLRLLWYAINNEDVLTDELDGLLHDACRRMADLDSKLLNKAKGHVTHVTSPAMFGTS